MRKLIFVLAFVLSLSFGGELRAWGDTGHRTVCEIAFLNLTPRAQAEVTRLLSIDHVILDANQDRNRRFGWLCTYPDNLVTGGPPRRTIEHFVNYPRTLLAVTSSTGCGAAQRCVLSAIRDDLARLRSASLGDDQRLVALAYLGHWVGDVHQPLHASYRDDEGGNQVNSRRRCTGKFHSTWDSCMLTLRLYGDVDEPGNDVVAAMAQTLRSEFVGQAQGGWVRARPWQWARESYAITRDPGTRYCVIVGSACQYKFDQLAYLEGETRSSVLIDDAYLDMAIPIIRERMTRAGFRLARMLNQALDPEFHG